MSIKKRTWAAACLALLALARPAVAAEVRLRFSTAVEKLKYGAVDLGVTGWAEEIKLRTSSFSNLEFISQTVGELKLGYGFEGELQFLLSRRFGIGLSGGYAYGSLPEEKALTLSVWDGVTYYHTKPAKMSAYPVLASAYIFLPIGRRVDLYLKGGAGFVFAKFVGREGLRKPDEKNYFYTLFETATARRGAYAGGLGLSFDLDDSLGFFLEADLRSARVDGFDGEDNLMQAGRLYAYEQFIPDLGLWQPKIHVLPRAPEGAEFREVHEASLDLGGYGARLGVMLRF